MSTAQLGSTLRWIAGRWTSRAEARARIARGGAIHVGQFELAQRLVLELGGAEVGRVGQQTKKFALRRALSIVGRHGWRAYSADSANCRTTQAGVWILR